MPIYEFLCAGCNRIYSFHTFSASSTRQPTCPRCGATSLRRVPSRFGVGVSRPAATLGADVDPDDPRVEREMTRFMSELEGLEGESPQAMAGAIRRMAELSGEPITPSMDEMIRRLEAGEDPDRLEEEMGEALEEEMGLDDGAGRAAGPPERDSGLYPL